MKGQAVHCKLLNYDVDPNGSIIFTCSLHKIKSQKKKKTQRTNTQNNPATSFFNSITESTKSNLAKYARIFLSVWWLQNWISLGSLYIWHQMIAWESRKSHVRVWHLLYLVKGNQVQRYRLSNTFCSWRSSLKSERNSYRGFSAAWIWGGGVYVHVCLYVQGVYYAHIYAFISSFSWDLFYQILDNKVLDSSFRQKAGAWGKPENN